MDIINPFNKNVIKVETEFCGRPLSLEVNRVGFRSKAAVLATYGQTVVLAVVSVGEVNPNLDYFPLSVDYEERFYAAGKISGSRFIKREGRPSDEAVLTGRLIDRPIRPLFPKGYRNEVQAVATVLSLDPAVKADGLAMVAISAAMCLSGAPFGGPVGGVRIAEAGGELIVCPDRSQQAASALDIMVASNEKGVMMVEAGAKQVDEAMIEAALELGHESNQQLIALQAELIKKVGVEPQAYELALPSEEVQDFVAAWLSGKEDRATTGDFATRTANLKALKDEFKEHLAANLDEDTLANGQGVYHEALEALTDKKIRERIVTNGERIDGRGLDEVRPLSSQVSVLPRVHGSALFTRGATQALNVITLAPPSYAQSLDTMELEEEKYYLHHYNAPGYTVGEIKRLGSPGRREIGHSYLAERALLPVIPSQDDFPYTIRSVTEIMSQHGSTSMAATCASCLALMDAGVPIKAPVSGVAMGLILKDDGRPVILTDIADAEDFAGDMDFKVAGTPNGVTALQMDMKVAGLPPAILSEALAHARKGRSAILKHMLSVLDRPRPEMSDSAPRVEKLKIPVSKIKDVIGKSGETINSIIDQTGTQIDIQDDGTVLIFSADRESAQQAVEHVKNLTQEPEVGRIYRDRPVVKVADFGVFVNLFNNQDGMVHVSEINDQHVRHPSDVLKEGDKVDVKLVSIDDQGRLSLSIRQAKDKKSKGS
ncbi:polyribonucleotide nucleotidyltransferase [Candidatus Saccharibacteria bacterium]|nr:polyribonucleotide nucleotidyltransferase [Candidatus Saccharibacteria bacterium]